MGETTVRRYTEWGWPTSWYKRLVGGLWVAGGCYVLWAFDGFWRLAMAAVFLTTGLLILFRHRVEVRTRCGGESFTGFGFLEKWDREPDQVLARRVRELRLDEGASWRGVASAIYDEFDGNWMPKGNQLAGMDLCDWAASQFGENYMDGDWN